MASAETTPLLLPQQSNNTVQNSCKNQQIEENVKVTRDRVEQNIPVIYVRGTSITHATVSLSFSRKQKLTLATFIIINFTSTVCYSLIAPFFPGEASSKGASDTVIGLIFGLHELVIFLSSPIYGRYMTAIGSKFMFFAGIFICGGSTILFGFLDQIHHGTMFISFCFALRAVEALGASAYITASFAICAKVFPENVGTTLGLLETFAGLGMAAGPPLGGLLYNLGGYKLPFFVTGSFLILILPLTISLLPSQDDSRREDTSTSVWKMMFIPDILLTMLVLMVVASSICFLDPSLQPFLQNTFDLSALYVGLMFLCISITYTIVAPVFGYIADKRPKWPLALMAIGSGVSSISYLTMAPSPILHIKSSVWLSAVSLVILGLGCGVLSMPSFKYAFSAVVTYGYPDDMDTYGMVSGLVNSGFSLGAFLGPTVGGGALLEEIGFAWTTTLLAALNAGILVLVTTFIIYRRVSGARVGLRAGRQPEGHAQQYRGDSTAPAI